jgi:hypothetical protein
MPVEFTTANSAVFIGAELEEVPMKKLTLMSVAIAAALSLGATGGFAQEGLHNAKKQNQAPAKQETGAGLKSSVPEGQGGTAGSHPTGANVGPGKAEMNHAN